MQDRELERELRELGSLIDYPPTPNVARAARNVLDEAANEQSRRLRRAFPTMRWAAVAAAFVLVVAVPTLSPGLRATVSDWFVAEDFQSTGVDAGSPERQSEAGAPAAGVSKSATTPAQAPQFSGERISVREAQARMDGTLLLPRTPKLGKPEEIYTVGTASKEGVMLVYKYGLPPLGDTGIHLVLTEVPGDLEPAYLTGRTTAGSKFDRVSVDGNPGYWRSAGNRLPGQTLLWEQGGVALRLEANVKKEQAIRIAESAR
ncbi:MAG TPA: DUF4367 domain-containing protein [Rubrobacter sp.]|jgi:Domain of unknown function (DUF4367)|nr:DUF4367 domain-containing protein [Rubrobacter sp.]